MAHSLLRVAQSGQGGIKVEAGRLNSRALLCAPRRGYLAPHETHSFLMALEAVTPRQPEQRLLPDRTGQRGQRTAAASSSRAGYTQGPRPRLRGPWALIFSVLGVLLLVSSRREYWLQKALLVARKRPGGTWLGKCRQDPPGQVQCAVCWWGALEECGSLASTRCPEELAPWST